MEHFHIIKDQIIDLSDPNPQLAACIGLYLPWVIPYGIHVESMEFMWNEDGMINSTWIPYGMQAYPPWIPWNSPYGFHGTNLILW